MGSDFHRHTVTPVPSNDYRTMYTIYCPAGKTGMVTWIGNNIYDDTYYIMIVDGQRRKYDYRVGTMHGPTKVGNLKFRDRVEIIAFNNSAAEHDFEFLVKGQFFTDEEKRAYQRIKATY